MIERTPAHAILQHDLLALGSRLPSYVAGRVALLGDAAHAMPPFLGQGGGQAIEDAVVLAASLTQPHVGRVVLDVEPILARGRTRDDVVG